MKSTIKYLISAMLIVSANVAIAQQQGDASKAAQPIQTSDSGWQLICRPMQPERTKLMCAVVHETFAVKDRLRVLAVEIVKNQKITNMIFSTPIGVDIKSGVEVLTDGGNRQQAQFSNCQANTCLASVEVNSKFMDSLQKAKVISVTFADAQGGKVKVDLSSAGLALALAKAE